MQTRLPVVAMLVALLAGLFAAPAAAGVDVDAEARLVAAMNADRAAAGLAPLQVATDLTAVARAHAARMADAADLHHNPDLPGEVAGWQRLGENVGRGPDVDAIHAALMASPSHRANLLDDDFGQIGVGVEHRDGRYWVAQVFRLPDHADDPVGSGRMLLVLAQQDAFDEAVDAAAE